MLTLSGRHFPNPDQIQIKFCQSLDIVTLYMCIKFESDLSSIRRITDIWKIHVHLTQLINVNEKLKNSLKIEKWKF